MHLFWGPFWVIVCLSAVSFAQAQVPSTAQPGRIEDRFKPLPRSSAVPDADASTATTPTTASNGDALHFTLTAVVIEGNTVFRAGELEALYKPLIGKDIPLNRVFQLRDAITAKYRSDGFILSQAVIPPQKLANGIVHINVVEGYIDSVEVQGKVADTRALISRTASVVIKSRPLRESALERYVLLISDIPGITVRTVIKPSKDKSGAADLVVLVE